MARPRKKKRVRRKKPKIVRDKKTKKRYMVYKGKRIRVKSKLPTSQLQIIINNRYGEAKKKAKRRRKRGNKKKGDFSRLPNNGMSSGVVNKRPLVVSKSSQPDVPKKKKKDVSGFIKYLESGEGKATQKALREYLGANARQPLQLTYNEARALRNNIPRLRNTEIQLVDMPKSVKYKGKSIRLDDAVREFERTKADLRKSNIDRIKGAKKIGNAKRNLIRLIQQTNPKAEVRTGQYRKIVG